MVKIIENIFPIFSYNQHTHREPSRIFPSRTSLMDWMEVSGLRSRVPMSLTPSLPDRSRCSRLLMLLHTALTTSSVTTPPAQSDRSRWRRAAKFLKNSQYSRT